MTWMMVLFFVAAGLQDAYNRQFAIWWAVPALLVFFWPEWHWSAGPVLFCLMSTALYKWKPGWCGLADILAFWMLAAKTDCFFPVLFLALAAGILLSVCVRKVPFVSCLGLSVLLTALLRYT